MRRKTDKLLIYGLGALAIMTQVLMVSISLLNSYWIAKFIDVVDSLGRAAGGSF